MATLLLPGNAVPADVSNGKTFSAGVNFNAPGTLPVQGAITLTPSSVAQAIPAGIHNGAGQVTGVSVPAGSVLTGTTIAGTAGTMPNNGAPGWTPTTVNQGLAAGYYSGGTVYGSGNLVPGNIANGVNIFGVVGNVQPKILASGTGTGSGAVATFSRSEGSGASMYYLTVSGLTFQPNYIIIATDVGAWYNTIFVAGVNLALGGINPCSILVQQLGIQSAAGLAYVNATGFQLPIGGTTASLACHWWAYA